ncbi:MAG TPA: helix-turn-helix domain-containing protein [Acidimicrobiales bacterium]
MPAARKQPSRRLMAPPEPDPLEPARLSRAERRDALLDATAALVETGYIEDVSMDAVAERAGVSRPLVYKHFANRSEMLGALYQREAAHLHAEMAAQVMAAETLEDMFRALVRSALRARATRGAAFTALRGAGVRDRERREEQRRRDRTTLRYFATRVERDFHLDGRRAKAGAAILLGAVEAVLAQWRVRPTREHATQLEDTYVALVMGGLEELARR